MMLSALCIIGISIICATTDAGTLLRLVGSTNTTGARGRLEVYHNGSWGTVCGDGFSYNSAKVACHTLGYAKSGATPLMFFGGGTGPILLDDVMCTGQEWDIDDCYHRPWGTNNCRHHEDVGVVCSFTTPLRLLGTRPSTGMLQAYHDKQWENVCYTGYTFADRIGSVACRMLGFQAEGSLVQRTDLTRACVRCDGTEGEINACTQAPYRYYSIRVTCLEDFSLRLVTTITPGVKHLSVLHSNKWGYVCGDSFSVVEARVACKKLGLPWTGAYNTAMDPKRGSEMFIWLQNITCTGNEESLEFCAHSGWGEESCATFTGLVCTEARMILFSSANDTEEIVEVAYNSTWGGVCAYTFDDMAAKVACRMTGQPIEHAHVGTPQRDVDIVLRVQSCLGNETSLGQCEHDGWGQNGNCKTGASVRCSFAAETHLEPSKKVLDVHLGDQLDIKCVVDNAHPRVENFTWYFKGMEVGNGETFALSAQRGDQGELKCVADNGFRPIAGASSTLVNILYPPDVSCEGEHTVTEGGRVFINCSADSNPQPLNLTWTKATESFQAGVDGGMILLSLDNVDLDATGTYVLTVINAMVDYRGVARYGSSSTSVYIAVKAFPSRMFMNATIVVSFVAVVLASALVVTIVCLARRGVHKPTSRYEATTERSVHFQSSPNVYIEEQGTSGAGNCQTDGEEYFSQLDCQTRDLDASRYETTPERSVHFQSSPNVYIEEQGTSGAGNCQTDGDEYYSEVDYQTRDLGEENIYENTMTK